MNLGIALSGGGVRATVFHLGVLERLARNRLLEATTFISTVSGGSLAAGLVIASADLGPRWPSSAEYLENIVPALRCRLTTSTVQWSYAWRSVALPWRLVRGRAHVLAEVLRDQWGISGTLDQLPASPRWFINATCYETGKNWRFSQLRMGDYATNYVVNPVFPIADALAASAAVPGLIGPLIINPQDFQWSRFNENGELTPTDTKAKRFELWDGGVYDNLGLEALYKPGKGFREGMDFALISDASALLRPDPRTIRRILKPGHRVLRLIEIATDQVRGLRARNVVADFEKQNSQGVYLKIGNTTATIYARASVEAPKLDVLTEPAVRQAADLETTLRRLTTNEFDVLFRHGYEVADATLCSRKPQSFQPIAFKTS